MVRFELSFERQMKGQQGRGGDESLPVGVISTHAALSLYWCSFCALTDTRVLATMTRKILPIIQCQPI